jgi:hypothetical protein
LEKYSLNDETLKFIHDFERNIANGEVFSNKELIERFNGSIYNKSQFNSYIAEAKSKSIWWAVKRSGNWLMQKKGIYVKHFKSDLSRDDFIKHLSANLYQVLMLKKEIKDEVLRKYYFSSKGIGDDLFYLTESYYRQKGLYKGKHSMSDFITAKAKEIIESGASISNELKYEHMVPKNIYISKMTEATLVGKLREELIYELLHRYYYVCTVTAEEDRIFLPQKCRIAGMGITPSLVMKKQGLNFSKTRSVKKISMFLKDVEKYYLFYLEWCD